MSNVKRFKFHGSEIAVLTEFPVESPAIQISAITAANPPVVTTGTHGLATGDVVKLTEIVGMTELNGDIYVIEVLSPTTFSLEGVNAENYAAYVSGGAVDVGTFSNFCELTNYNRQGGASPEIPATGLCSEAEEYEIGLPDFGTTQLDFNFAPRTTIQGALHGFYESGTKTAVKITLPNSGGEMVQLGFVQQESEQAGNGSIWTASATIRNTGRRVDIAAA